MLTEERFSRILAIVDLEGSVKVPDLVQRLGISESTVRRDLAAMDEKGMLVKVYGGAISVNHPKMTVLDESIVKRKTQFTEEKRRIAKYAASLIGEDDFVYLDAGTTTELIPDYLNGITGIYQTPQGYYVRDRDVEEFDKDFPPKEKLKLPGFGTNGISLVGGFTTPDPREAAVKAAAMSACRQSYILADESKFRTESNVRFARYEDAAVITNRVPEGDWKKQDNIITV